jgi:stage IV sporulation protein FB
MFETGYLTIARWKGTPIRIHWSTPIGMLVFGRFAFVPGFWLGFLILVVLHEMGHALLARRMGLHARSIEIHALGGQCRFGGGSVSPWQHAVVAWGGVLAQGALLGIALAVSLFAPLPPVAFVGELMSALVYTNLWLIAINLLPIPPLDGAQAWRLLPLWRERRARRAARDARDRVEVRARPVGGRLDVHDVDEAAVRETVRRALQEAARDARGGRARKEDPS